MSTVVVPPRAAMMVTPSPVTVVPPTTVVPMSDLLDVGPDCLRQNDPSAAYWNHRRCGRGRADGDKGSGEDKDKTLLPHGTSS
jgi:hypothetical protein